MNTEIIKNEIESDITSIAKTLIGRADDLAFEHEKFHTNYVVAGRIALYELLGKIYTLSLELDRAMDKAEQVKIMRSVLIEKYGIRTQDNTHDLTVLVRYITRADRKTAHVYTRAIQSAKESGVKPENIVGFIEYHGGIERIRVATARYDEDLVDKKIELTEKLLTVMTNSPIARFVPDKKWDSIGDQNYIYDFYISTKVGNENCLIAKIPSSSEFERIAIKQLSKYVCEDMDFAQKKISELYGQYRKERLKQANNSDAMKS